MSPREMLPSLILLGLCILPAMSVHGQTIADEAGLFKEATRVEAVEIFQELHTNTGLEFRVETVGDTNDTPAGRFALERAREQAVFGAYIMIAVEARKIEIKVAGSLKEILTPELTDRMREAMIESFREEEFDDGLLALAETAADELREVRVERPERIDWARPPARITEPGKHLTLGLSGVLLCLVLLGRFGLPALARPRRRIT